MAATIQDIAALLDQRFAKFKAEMKMEILKELDQRMTNMDETITKNSMNISANTSSIEGISNLVEHQNDIIEKLQKECDELKTDLDEQINRSLRGNIIVKGIPDT